MKTGRRTNYFGILFLVCGIAISARADALDTWFVRNSGTANPIYAVAYGGSNFVAVGSASVLLTSTNGSDWVTRNSGQHGDMYCITYGNGLFVAAASGGSLTNIAVSMNTSNWLGFLSAADVVVSMGASYVGGFYIVAGSSATIQTATNVDLSCAGKFTNCNWVLRNGGGNRELKGVAYGNGVYVVVGDSVAMTSTDAITWTSNSISGYMYDVAFGNGVFVAAGLNGKICTSTDGLTWIARNFETDHLFRVTFGNGTFVAVGREGTILTSTDGIMWKRRATPVTAWLTGVTYGNGMFVATGFEGTILQSAPVSVPSLTANRDVSGGGIALTLAGEMGRGYRIQVSTNMASTDWEDFLAFTNTAPTMEFLDTSVTNLSQRFYRAVSP